MQTYITGIRCGSNLMPINYLRKFYVKRNQRFCNLCNLQTLGSELHVTMKCPNVKLVKHRTDFINLIFVASAQLQLPNTEQLFTYLIVSVEVKITYYFAVFLNKIHKLLKQQSKKK